MAIRKPLSMLSVIAFGVVGWFFSCAGSLSAQTIKIVELEEKLTPAEREELIAHVKEAWEYHRQHFDLPEEITLKLRLFRTWKGFNAYRSQHTNLNMKTGGYYSPRTQELVTMMERANRKPRDYMETVIHEAIHHLMELGFPRMPIWMNEGFAEFFSNTKMSSRGDVTYPFDRRWFANVSTWKSHGQVPSIRDLLRTTYHEFNRYSDRTYGDRSYGMAYTLTYYLMSTPENREILSDALKDASQPNGISLEEALADHYPGGLSRLQNDWHRFIKRPKSIRDF